jgi:hypothetical protein
MDEKGLGAEEGSAAMSPVRSGVSSTRRRMRESGMSMPVMDHSVAGSPTRASSVVQLSPPPLLCTTGGGPRSPRELGRKGTDAGGKELPR